VPPGSPEPTTLRQVWAVVGMFIAETQEPEFGWGPGRHEGSVNKKLAETKDPQVRYKRQYRPKNEDVAGMPHRGTVVMAKSLTCNAVAYIRVSTGKQAKSGLGLEAQIEAIGAFAKSEGYRLTGRSRSMKPARERMRLTGARSSRRPLRRLKRPATDHRFQTRPAEPGRAFHLGADGSQGALHRHGVRQRRRSVCVAPVCRLGAE
jgi:hypothetical protein